MGKGRIGSIVGIIAGLLFVGIGVLAIIAALGSAPQGDGDGGQPAEEPQGLAVKAFPDYSWEEIGEIADLMEAAPDEASARGIAQDYGLVDEAGALTAQTHELELDNGVTAEVRLVGILHDERSDGGGRAALTFMASPVEYRRYNGAASSEGGWRASEIRAWLGEEGLELLPDELSSRIVSVCKPANNVGKTDDPACVTLVDDTLWLFSCREVCGPITWLSDEFDYLAEDNDAILNAEGEQYEAFARAGIDQRSDSEAYLMMRYRGEAVPWWYRTPYAFQFLAETDDAIYQVTASGFARAVNLADDQAGIVVGFCL